VYNGKQLSFTQPEAVHCHLRRSCRIVSAAAGIAHSMALASDGSLFTWGDGSQGQLGHSQLQQIAAVMPQVGAKWA